jgi:cholesterol oxidase
MPDKFDVIVIGSGFGGAVNACRLSEAGARVLVLERGRRWTKETYPRKADDAWIYHPRHPQKHNGWLDIRAFRGMIVAQGAGVGGGSNCYSSVVMEADPERFKDGWPPEVTYQALQPYYQKVRETLALVPIPAGQRTHRAELLRRAAGALGMGARVEEVPLAIAFDPAFTYDRPDPLSTRHSKTFVNAHGVTQGTCVHLGNCDIGCDVHAKNTLDLNYIAVAERHGAQVRPLHLVRNIEPVGAAYRVIWDEIRDGQFVRGSAEADRVILAAGSLGSTELLLRCRDEHGTLPRVGGRLGLRWSSNANVLAPAVYPRNVEVKQGIGPTISAGLNFMDGSEAGEHFYVEDDGFPNLLINALTARVRAGGMGPMSHLMERWLRRSLTEKNPTEQTMIWLGEGLDGADGRLHLGRRTLKPWERTLKMDWRAQRSRGVIEAILSVHQRLTGVDGGRLQYPFFWRVLKTIVTVHPLGGCAMGRGPSDGVVDHRGEVFGYPHLYVADGALLPHPTGRNPSMTIAALAERVAHLISQEG